MVYIGTQNGPYRSTDHGDHWEKLNVPDHGLPVWSLLFDPRDPKVMYAGYENCEIYRSKNEVAYEGRTAGVDYIVSYILMKETSPQTLTVATAVKTGNKKSRYYWMVAKQVHRRLMPYLVDRMVTTAPD